MTILSKCARGVSVCVRACVLQSLGTDLRNPICTAMAEDGIGPHTFDAVSWLY